MDLEPVDLYYEETGQGYPVVLLHGYPLNHTIWNPVVERLKEHARVITPDLRGHGQSPVTDGEYSMRLMAEDVHTLLKKLGVQKAVVVGHSMGGYVSLAFARAYPNCLGGLAMVASQAEADSPEKRQARYIAIEEVGRKGVRAVAKKMLPKLTPRKDLAPELLDMMQKTPKKGVIGALKGMAERPDALEWLAEIAAPAVVIAGEGDVIIPIEHSRTMAQMLTRGWLMELPHASH
ncbi:MAG: alpha/beta hydrolase, partial [Rhodocyclaceae bacterium]|nr:alpha/beta hydrolase [Rhodocyclaceae bacterium]